MAEVATFVFNSESEQDRASDQISRELGSGGHQGFTHKLVILDSCSDVGKAMSICIANGGKSE